MNELLEKLEDEGAEVEETLDRLMDDEQLYLEYLYKLVDNTNIIKLRDAVNNKDSDEAMKEVHTLKGVALNLGLLPLVDATMDMLLDFRDNQSESGFSQIDEVEKEFNKWCDIIKPYIK